MTFYLNMVKRVKIAGRMLKKEIFNSLWAAVVDLLMDHSEYKHTHTQDAHQPISSVSSFALLFLHILSSSPFHLPHLLPFHLIPSPLLHFLFHPPPPFLLYPSCGFMFTRYRRRLFLSPGWDAKIWPISAERKRLFLFFPFLFPEASLAKEIA